MKGWKYYLLVLPFYILVAPFVVICLFTEFWILIMALLRLVVIVPLYFIMGVAAIFEPKLLNNNLIGDAKYKIAVTMQVIKDEVKDSKYFLKNFLLLLRESKDDE